MGKCSTVDALEALVEELFDCVIGEPRAYTHDPPWSFEEMQNPSLSCADRNPRYVYFVLALGQRSNDTTLLVDALSKEFRKLRDAANAYGVFGPGEKPRLLWRTKPQLELKRTTWRRSIRTRIAIPVLHDEFGELQKPIGTLTRSFKPEGADYPGLLREQPVHRGHGICDPS